MTSTVKLCSLRPAERERHAMTSNSECPGRRHDTATLSARSAVRPVLMLRSVLTALSGGAAGPANGPCVSGPLVAPSAFPNWFCFVLRQLGCNPLSSHVWREL
jgi:hypothetical protein